MTNLSQLTKDDLENLIEQKIMEILGDPDTSLGLKPEFRAELKKRIAKRSKRVHHEEVLKKFGSH
jgi:hypothetical protein